MFIPMIIICSDIEGKYFILHSVRGLCKTAARSIRDEKSRTQRKTVHQSTLLIQEFFQVSLCIFYLLLCFPTLNKASET